MAKFRNNELTLMLGEKEFTSTDFDSNESRYIFN